MEEYLKQVPNVKAVVAGTRRTDPFSAHLTTFCPTDNGWPALTRINPILDWSYQDVWNVMLAYKFPYCCLYDKGSVPHCFFVSSWVSSLIPFASSSFDFLVLILLLPSPFSFRSLLPFFPFLSCGFLIIFLLSQLHVARIERQHGPESNTSSRRSVFASI